MAARVFSTLILLAAFLAASVAVNAQESDVVSRLRDRANEAKGDARFFWECLVDLSQADGTRGLIPWPVLAATDEGPLASEGSLKLRVGVNDHLFPIHRNYRFWVLVADRVPYLLGAISKPMTQDRQEDQKDLFDRHKSQLSSANNPVKEQLAAQLEQLSWQRWGIFLVPLDLPVRSGQGVSIRIVEERGARGLEIKAGGESRRLTVEELEKRLTLSSARDVSPPVRPLSLHELKDLLEKSFSGKGVRLQVTEVRGPDPQGRLRLVGIVPDEADRGGLTRVGPEVLDDLRKDVRMQEIKGLDLSEVVIATPEAPPRKRRFLIVDWSRYMAYPQHKVWLVETIRRSVRQAERGGGEKVDVLLATPSGLTVWSPDELAKGSIPSMDTHRDGTLKTLRRVLEELPGQATSIQGVAFLTWTPQASLPEVLDSGEVRAEDKSASLWPRQGSSLKKSGRWPASSPSESGSSTADASGVLRRLSAGTTSFRNTKKRILQSFPWVIGTSSRATRRRLDP